MFKRINRWVDDKGYTIRFGTSDYVDYDQKEVVLYKNKNSAKSIVYTSLHECGHIVIGHRKSYFKDYKAIVRADSVDGRHYRSNLYKYKKIKEEISAWEEGYRLANKLGIKIDKDDYDKFAAKNLVTYC